MRFHGKIKFLKYQNDVDFKVLSYTGVDTIVDKDAILEVFGATCENIELGIIAKMPIQEIVSKNSKNSKNPSTPSLDINNNEEKKEKPRLPKRLTRKSKKSNREKLINPIKYFDCILCTRSDYGEKSLRVHYKNRHKLDFGQAPLPKNTVELTNFKKDLKKLYTNKCYICFSSFKSKELLRLHKSLHVDSRFGRHKCNKCGTAFILKEVLENHHMICPKDPPREF